MIFLFWENEYILICNFFLNNNGKWKRVGKCLLMICGFVVLWFIVVMGGCVILGGKVIFFSVFFVIMNVSECVSRLFRVNLFLFYGWLKFFNWEILCICKFC